MSVVAVNMRVMAVGFWISMWREEGGKRTQRLNDILDPSAHNRIFKNLYRGPRKGNRQDVDEEGKQL